jgi:HEAT repeat protein
MEITEKDINELINSLKDVDFDVRNSIGDILVKTGEPAVPYLIKALKHENSDIQVESAKILGRLADKDALEALILALKDENVQLRKEAAISINKILENKGF